MQDAVSIAVSPAPESRTGERLRTVARNAFPFLVVGALWEIVARAGVFPRKLFPTLGDVATAFVDLTRAGILPMHAAETHEFMASLHPVGHMGDTGDITDAILFLENAPFVTGEILHVDGGQSAGH